MKPNVRACVAYVAGSLISGRSSSSVYDYSQGKHISISGSVDARAVNIYDHDQGCNFGGNGSNGDFSLYHYGDSHHVSLKIQGNNFNGYDYGHSCHFSGTVNAGNISLYDYETGSHFNYSL